MVEDISVQVVENITDENRVPQAFEAFQEHYGKTLTELDLLESTDIIADTQKAVEDKVKDLGKVAGMINFHCILRTLELESKGITEPYGRIFRDIPTIGFSTYGEEYIGHINQTSTILTFK